MSNYLSEHDLENLFRENLPRLEIPPELAMRLEAQVLTEVEQTIKAADNHVTRTGSPVWRNPLTNWLERFGWARRFERASSLALAGASLAVLLLFVLLLPRLIPNDSSAGNQSAAPQLEVLAPAQPVTPGNAQTADVAVRNGAASLFHNGATNMLTAGSSASLAPGDVLQVISGQTDITYFTGQRTTMAAGAQLRLVELNQNGDATQVVILVESGHTRHQVETPLTADDRFEVRTAAARALVLGTDFVVDARTIDETYIATAAGLVFVETADDRVQVAAGQEVIAHTGAPMVVRAQPTPTVALVQADAVAALPTPTDLADNQPAVAPTSANSADDTSTAAQLPTPTRVIVTSTPAALPDNAADNEPTPIVVAVNGAPTASVATTQAVIIPTATAEQSGSGAQAFTATPTATETPSPTATSIQSTATTKPANTATPTSTPTNTPSDTVALPTATATRTAAPTPTPISTPTLAPSPTPSSTTPPAAETGNKAPMAVDDVANASEDQKLIIPVLDNDRDADDDLLVITGVTEPLHGQVTNNGNGTVTYTPAANYAGPDQFTYTISDGRGSASASVAVNIAAVNDKPSLSEIADQSLPEDQAINIDFVVGDVETSPDELVYRAAVADTEIVSSEGLTFSGAGVNRTLTIQPQPDQNGTTLITLTVDDGGDTVQRQFTLDITANNDAPEIGDLATQTIAEEEQATINLTIVDVDNADAELQVHATSSDQSLLSDENVRVEGMGADRAIVLQPESDRSGSTTITVRVNDGQAENTATFDLIVNPVNDAPVIGTIDDQVMDEGQALTLEFDLSDVDTNVNSLALQASSSESALINEDGLVIEGFGQTRTLTIAPVAGQSGAATITIVASDGDNQVESTFTLTVNAVDEPPTANQDEHRGVNGVMTVQVLVNDIDEAPDQLRVIKVGPAEHGVAATDGLIVTYTPDSEFLGTEIITYTVSDGVHEATSQITFIVEG